MRDLPFLLRLHALPPLARFPMIHLKPYLPLEVRYLIRPSEEVFLYLSNNSDNGGRRSGNPIPRHELRTGHS